MPEMLHSARDLGAVIRSRRKKLGYTQEEVAEFNGCSPRFISELERGVAAAKIESVLRVMNSLGLDLLAQERGDSTWR